MEFDFNANYQKVEKEFNLGKGEYFKPLEGANKVRLVSNPLPHDSVYMGKPQFKWLCQVLDRKDGKIKPYFMPNTIYRFIADLQLSEDYRFDGLPMPYDITINAKGAGTKEVQYSLIPSKETPLTTEEQNAITEAPTVKELQQKIREAEAKKPVEPAEPTEDTTTIHVEDEVNVDDIPF